MKIIEVQYFSENEIKEMLLYNNSALMKSLLLLYECQTEEEKEMGESFNKNNAGFNKYDSSILSKYSREIKDKGGLYKYQIKELRKRILKYNKQITKIINNKKAKEEGVQLKWEI
jgi:hypothetical protein